MHNSYLTVLIELGVIGSLFLLVVFIWLLIEQVKALLKLRSLMGLVGLGRTDRGWLACYARFQPRNLRGHVSADDGACTQHRH